MYTPEWVTFSACFWLYSSLNYFEMLHYIIMIEWQTYNNYQY